MQQRRADAVVDGATNEKSWPRLVELLDGREFEAALTLCNRELATLGKPESAVDWHMGAARALVGLGRPRDALDHATDAALVQPDHGAAVRLVASISLLLGQLDAALAAAQYAQRLLRDEASQRLVEEIQARRHEVRQQSQSALKHEARGPARPRAAAPSVKSASAAKAGSAFDGQTLRLEVAQRAAAPAAPTPAAPTPALDAQLAALFGVRLFGAWTASVAPAGLPGWARAGESRLPQRLAAALVAVTLVGGAALAIGYRALVRQRHVEGVKQVEAIAELLRVGSVEALGAAVDAARAAVVDDEAVRSAEDPLLARADATAWRYCDAQPARRARVLAATAGVDNAGVGDLVVARALIISEADQAPLLPMLRRLAGVGKDAQAALLVAVILLRANDLSGAEQAVRRALELEPANVIVLAESAWIRVRRGQGRLAESRSAEALDMDPRSSWARLAQARLALLKTKAGAPPLVAADASPVPLRCTVAEAEAEIVRAALASRRGDDTAAETHVSLAAQKVGQAPELILDLAERLNSVGLARLVRPLTQLHSWPREHSAAVALITDRPSAAVAPSPPKARPKPTPSRSGKRSRR